MALKAGLEQWNLAVQTFEADDHHNALAIFTNMGGTAKIHFNIGIIYGLLGNHGLAISSLSHAIRLDNYLAIGYFARALSNIELGDFESALEDFNDTLLYLRGNQHIDYFQLGLDFKLYSCEVLYNRAVCYYKLGFESEAMNDILAASKEKHLPNHDLISKALDQSLKNATFFNLPEGCLFRPCENMVKNTKKIDYLGQAKVIAANTQAPAPSLSSKTNRQFPETNLTSTALNGLNPPKSSPTLASRSTTIANTNLPPPPKAPLRSKTMQTFSSPSEVDTLRRAGTETRRRPEFDSNVIDKSQFVPAPRKESMLRNGERILAVPPSQPRTPPQLASSPDDDSFLFPSKPPSLTNSFPNLSSPSLTDLDSNKIRAPVPKGKMKIKCHYQDTRSLMVAADSSFSQLQLKIQEKFASPTPLKLKYKDEDEELVLITDQEDLDMALASLCPNSDGTLSHLDPAAGFDGRFELWCSL